MYFYLRATREIRRYENELKWSRRGPLRRGGLRGQKRVDEIQTVQGSESAREGFES